MPGESGGPFGFFDNIRSKPPIFLALVPLPEKALAWVAGGFQYLFRLSPRKP